MERQLDRRRPDDYTKWIIEYLENDTWRELVTSAEGRPPSSLRSWNLAFETHDLRLTFEPDFTDAMMACRTAIIPSHFLESTDERLLRAICHEFVELLSRKIIDSYYLCHCVSTCDLHRLSCRLTDRFARLRHWSKPGSKYARRL